MISSFFGGKYMSVIKSERDTSEVEFINNARKLEIFTIQKCVNLIPKRYTFFIANKLADSAHEIYSNAVKGNSVYPTNRHEVQMRKDYFMKAVVEARSLVSHIDIAYELLHFDIKIMRDWMKLVNDEINLLKGVIKKDQARYKNIE